MVDGVEEGELAGDVHLWEEDGIQNEIDDLETYFPCVARSEAVCWRLADHRRNVWVGAVFSQHHC